MNKCKPDYQLRAELLNDHPEIFSLVKKDSRYWYKFFKDPDLVTESDYAEISDGYRRCLEDPHLTALLNDARKCFRSDIARRSRLRKRITAMLYEPCVFLTLTFSDESLSSTSAKTRRTAVQRYLKSCDCAYVGNIDFGSDNGREHYHAVVGAPEVDLTAWKYGFAYAERINRPRSSERLSRYICKLVNHAVKDTAGRNALIYSRSVSPWKIVPEDELPF